MKAHSAKRANFLDYFPRLKETYKGYVTQNIFEGKMKNLIRQSVEAVKQSQVLYSGYSAESSMYKIPSGDVVVSKSSIDQSGLDKRTAEREKDFYYECIRSELLNLVWGEQWREANVLSGSEEMFAQSNGYLTSAAISAASWGAGKVIGKVAKSLNVKTVQNFRARLPNTGFSITNNTQMLGKSNYNITTRASFTVKNSNLTRKVSLFKGIEPKTNGSITLAEFDAQNYVSDKGFKIMEKSNDFQSIDCFDFGFKQGWAQNLNKALDIATDFIPLIGIPKVALNTGFNALVGFQTRATAQRMKDLEDRGNAAERKFNQKLKQTIYDDVDALSLEDVRGVVGMIE